MRVEKDKIKLRTSQSLHYDIKDNGNVEITDLISGKKYHLTKQVYELLKEWETCSHSMEDMMYAKSNLYSTDELIETLNFLYQKSLIVHEDNDDTLKIISPSLPLFNLPTTEIVGQDNSTCIFIGVPYGSGNLLDSSCKLFPSYIRKYTHEYNIYLNDKKFKQPSFLQSLCLNDEQIKNLKTKIEKGQLVDYGDLFILENEIASSIYEKIYKVTSSIIKQNNIPFILGGDHSITYPAIQAVNATYSSFQVLHFDAHTDNYISATQELYQKLGKASHHHGNFIQKCLELKNLCKITQIGIRGIPNIMVRKNPIINVHSIEEMSKSNSANNLSINPAIPIYITFDIDFFDPSIAPGTATPVTNGAFAKVTFDFIAEILKNKKIIGMDLVEVNPKKDIGDITMQLATELLLHLISMIKH